MDYTKYPSNWLTEIRPHILKRSQDANGKECCEWCSAENERWIWYHPSASIEPAMMNLWTQVPKKAAYWYGAFESDIHNNPEHGYLVYLTIAHIKDPNPMNCADDNLAALCQTCHLRYDAKMKANNIKIEKLERQESAGQLSLW